MEETNNHNDLHSKLSCGKLEKLFSGVKVRNPKFQVANIEWMLPLNDSKHYSENVVFPPSLSSFVKKHLQEGMIIEMGKYSLKDFQHNNAAKSKALEIETFKPIKEVDFLVAPYSVRCHSTFRNVCLCGCLS